MGGWALGSWRARSCGVGKLGAGELGCWRAGKLGAGELGSDAADSRIVPWKEARALYANAVSGLPFRATPDKPPLAADMLA